MSLYEYSGYKFFPSRNVKVFPCAYRGNYSNGAGNADQRVFDPESRAFTEYNYTNIYSKQSQNKESFVISYESVDGQGYKLLKFVLGGYYFEVKILSTWLSELLNKKFVIKTRQIELTENDTTTVLDTFAISDSNANNIENEYYLDTKPDQATDEQFIGLAIVPTGTTVPGTAAELQPFKKDSTSELNWSATRLDDTLTSGDGSHSIRMVTGPQGACEAKGSYAVALNYGTEAVGTASLAVGDRTTARGKGSISCGYHTTSHAEAENQVVIGKYNQLDKDAIFIIGNGENNAPNNSFVIKANNGSIESNGSLTFSGLPISGLSMSHTLTLGSATSLDSGAINIYGSGSNKVFTVSNTGETYAASDLAVGENKFKVTASTGKTEISGDLKVNNDKFTVTASSGNLTTKGTAGIDGKLTCKDAIEANGDLTINGNGTSQIKSTKIILGPGNGNIDFLGTDDNATATLTNAGVFTTNGNIIAKGENSSITAGSNITAEDKVIAQNGFKLGENDIITNDGNIINIKGILATGDVSIGTENAKFILNETSGADFNTNLTVCNKLQITGDNNKLVAKNLCLHDDEEKASITVDNVSFDDIPTSGNIHNATVKVNSSNAIIFDANGHFEGNLSIKANAENQIAGGYSGGEFLIVDADDKVSTKITNSGAAYFDSRLIIGGHRMSYNSNMRNPSELEDDCLLYLDTNGARINTDIYAKNCTIAETLTVEGDGIDEDDNNAYALVVNGNLKCEKSIEAYSYNAKSDIRKKENIQEFVNNASILDLPIKTFTYKSDPTSCQRLGCIAQDLQKLYPELVHEDKDGFLTIEETKLVYLLIDEVKKLKAEIISIKGE